MLLFLLKYALIQHDYLLTFPGSFSDEALAFIMGVGSAATFAFALKKVDEIFYSGVYEY